MMIVHGKELDTFTVGFIDAMLWAETDNSDDSGGDPLENNYDIHDISPESLDKIIADCKAFQTDNVADIAAIPSWNGAGDSHGRNEYSGDECAGHDFYFTRNGHGVGFWDRDYDKDIRDRLTKASKAYGEIYPYVGDDGQLYVG
jgi:hypothetical protein